MRCWFAGEGKTYIAENLSIVFAKSGKKTLVIGADLRRPKLYSDFGLENIKGISSHIFSDLALSEVILKSDIENLDLIPSGIIPPNPSELLDSDLMQEFIDSVKSEYDVILFDSPPLIAVTDSYVLLKYISQFILVIRPGITETRALNRVISGFKHANFNITGVVMNAVTEEYSYGAGYYYNYYQYYYGDEK